MMFLLGALISYLIMGVVVLVCNSIDVDEDIKDLIFGWWLIPIIFLINKIKKILTKSN